MWGRKADRTTGKTDRMSSDWLAQFGRFKFLGAEAVGPFDELAVILPIVGDLYPQDTPAYAAIVAEVTRHSRRGVWESIGGWKFAREYLAGEFALVDAGLETVRSMRCTNLAMHLAPIDQRRWAEAIGAPVPNDGFIGPPVFDSEYGPTRQYYFDAARDAARRRSVARIPSALGVEPSPFLPDHAVENGLDSLAMLVYRGPLLVNPDKRSEHDLVLPAIMSARGADHRIFVERLADLILGDSLARTSPWGALGAALFIEDYLETSAVDTPGYDRLLMHGLPMLRALGWLGVTMTAETLTDRQRSRLATLG
jgi:hypothetical protein